MKMRFHSHADRTHFDMKGFARGIALKKRHKTIRKCWAAAIKVGVQSGGNQKSGKNGADG